MVCHNKAKNIFARAILIVLILISIMGVVSANYKEYLHTAVSIPTLPLEGGISVNPNTGAAYYQFPITLPPGINNLQPILSLNYNSHSYNSYPDLVGSSWSITTNYIERDTNHFPADQSKHTYNLYLEDQYFELVYNEEDHRYHTKKESYLWINKTTGGNNNYGEYWLVKKTDGTVYKFGYDYSSELASNTNNYVSRWYLDEISDIHGNKIFYSYQENPFTNDLGVTYPTNVTYNNDTMRMILFHYESLPLTWTIFNEGNKIRRTHKISSIQILTENQPVRSYNLSYITNQPQTRSYINMILVTGSEGGTFPPTTFNYSNTSYGWEELPFMAQKLPPTPFEYDGKDLGARVEDFNRDGHIDIISKARYLSAYDEAFLGKDGVYTYNDSYRVPYFY